MTGNVAFDVVIGLVFVYLLYSLYATIMMEILSSLLGLRAKNLRYTIARMLMNDKEFGSPATRYLANIGTTFVRTLGYHPNLKDPDLYKAFYKQPTIKYLGSGGFGGRPSYIAPESFSKALIDSIKIDNPYVSLMAAFEAGLENWESQTLGNNHQMAPGAAGNNNAITNDTASHIRSLMNDANNDPVKFKILLEQWFNDTMERSAGWFKQTTQIILLIVGAFIVIQFNVNTISIVKNLSIDKDARDKMVNMAIEFNTKNEGLINKVQLQANDTGVANLNKRLDSLQGIKQSLQNDILSSQSLVGSGWPLQDSIKLESTPRLVLPPDSANYQIMLKDNKTAYVLLHKVIDANIVRKLAKDAIPENGYFKVSLSSYRLAYIFSGNHLWGYILTILALSLGAPFWFDLLNKLIQLRTSKPADPGNTGKDNDAKKTGSTNRDILNRAG